MPVHHHHRVVHVHIPKTAGTTIGSLFAAVDDFEWNPNGWYGHQYRNGRHYELQHLSQLELHELSGGQFTEFRAFAPVRDPYQRLISEFHWRHGVGGDDTPVRRFATFDQLIAALPRDLDHEWFRYVALADRRHANLLIHLRPQSHYVCDHRGELDPSIDVVRFERLHDELTPLLERWGISQRPDRRTPRPKPLTDYFTRESLAVANQVYERDFEWFGYPRVTEPT